MRLRALGLRQGKVLVVQNGVRLIVDADKTNIREALSRRAEMDKKLEERAAQDTSAVSREAEREQQSDDVQAKKRRKPVRRQPVKPLLKGHDLPDADIVDVDIDTREKDATGRSIQKFIVKTRQENDPPFWARVRIYVEVEDTSGALHYGDREKTLYFGNSSSRQSSRSRGGSSRDTYEFHIICENMNRPKVNAYCVELYDTGNSTGALDRKTKRIKDLSWWLGAVKNYERMPIKAFSHYCQ